MSTATDHRPVPTDIDRQTSPEPPVPARDALLSAILKFRWRYPVQGLIFAPDHSLSDERLAAAVSHCAGGLHDEQPLALLGEKNGVLFTDSAVHYFTIEGWLSREHHRIPYATLEDVEARNSGLTGGHLRLATSDDAEPTCQIDLPALPDKEQRYTSKVTQLLCDMIDDLIDLYHPGALPREKHEAWFREDQLDLAFWNAPEAALASPMAAIVFPKRCVICLAPSTTAERLEVSSNEIEQFDFAGFVLTAGAFAHESHRFTGTIEPGFPYCDQHKRDAPTAGMGLWKRITYQWDPHVSARLVAAMDQSVKRPVVKSLGLHFDNPAYAQEFCEANGLPVG